MAFEKKKKKRGPLVKTSTSLATSNIVTTDLIMRVNVRTATTTTTKTTHARALCWYHRPCPQDSSCIVSYQFHDTVIAAAAATAAAATAENRHIHHATTRLESKTQRTHM